ncbi:MAG: alpha/beta hydrolase, partial [Planctomycetota bacterium]|nr:alpha/beta hydrolase [Planctomycetota bacterium]
MRFFAMIVLLCLMVSDAVGTEKSTVADLWYGEMDAGSRVFRFRIESVTDADGVKGQQLVSIDEGNQNFRLNDFHLDETRLTFALKISKATYAADLSDGGKTSVGKWTQAGKDFDLVFHKVDAVPIDQPTEIWSGKLDALFQKLTVQFRAYRGDDGTERLYFDSVSQRASGFKATRTIENDQWTIDVASLGGVFKGTIKADKSELNGKWTQGGIALDLTLTPEKKLSEEVTRAPNRPQTPKAPFPYQVEEVTFRNDSEGVELAGTLTLPKTDRPCPAVVMISGSGPQDRDETLLDHKPFWVIADHLSRHGVAVLRFDDRGTGASKGDFASATSENFANDVEAAFEHLVRDPRIAVKAVGLIGHSEGGLIAPIVVARRNDVAFAVLMAGTGVNGKEILLSQGQLILQAEGVNDASLLKVQRETQLAMIDTILDAAPDTPSDSLVNAAMKRLVEVLPEESLKEESLKMSVAAGIERIKSPWFRNFLTFEPASQLQRVKCPVLAINGEKDVQVDPRINLPAIQAALEKGGNSQFETIEFPALNHLFQTCTTGGLSEY